MDGALIGLGTIGRGHLKAYAQQGRLRLVATMDPLGPRDALSPYPGLRELPCYEDIEQLLDSTKLDFIDICSPPDSHAYYIHQGLSRGLHVLCEKPILHDDRDLASIVTALGQASTLLFPAHNYRFAPGILRLRDLVRSSSFGQIETVQVRTLRSGSARGVDDWKPDWRRQRQISGGGILRDHGPHSFYVLRFLTGLVPREVSCVIGNSGGEPAERDGSPPVEDTARVRIRFSEGVRGRMDLTWAASHRESIYRVRGSGEHASLSDDDLTRTTAHTSSRERIRSDFNDVTHSAWIQGVLAEFSEAMESNSHEIRHAAANRVLQEILDVRSAYQSARKRGEWTPIGTALDLEQQLNVILGQGRGSK